MTTTPIALWYGDKRVLYQICPFLYTRTTDYIAPHVLAEQINMKRFGYRYKRVVTLKGFEYLAEQFELSQKPYNLYASVAHVTPDFPMLSLLPTKEAVERKEINESFKQYVTGYDFVMDFDAEDIADAQKESIKVRKILEKHKVRHMVTFSGNKGFNIRVHNDDIPATINVLERPSLFAKLAEAIKKKLKLKTLDTSVYQLNRVFKVPYSVERRRNLVSLPLTNIQHDNFNEDEMHVSEVFRKFQSYEYYNRGMVYRPGEAGAFGTFLKAYV